MKTLANWIEIPATDINRAKEFYSDLLKIEMDLHDWGEEKMAFFPNREGAISVSPNFNPSADGPLVYFNCDGKIDECVARAEKLNATIVREITKIEADDAGSFALILDSEGNRVGLYDSEA